ncbi:carbohydrate sulfotransferase 15-like isoform X1 [Pomacea canaliculata]|uniref:carbohydrate sulfotransferase 15-like isoform X1 n=1 Tax=Pomacea canaliculata TaxID=400727 RepID=UPI000D730CDF|nr:carbohydrate sulfotransferase 15-like isoform X1 [Pomacea canaliculata]
MIPANGMVSKRKLPLAVGVSMMTMLFMHLVLPINLRTNSDGSNSDSNNQKRSVAASSLEACPDDGPLLPEETPFWSEQLDEFKKDFTLKFVGDKPVGEVCCAPDSAIRNKTYGFVDPPPYTDKSRNPCWYEGGRLRCLPYFYVIGSTKSGAPDLYKRLLAHPEVASTRKEVHWFNRLRTLGAGLRWYANVFNPVAKSIHEDIKSTGTSRKVIGEKTLDYFSDVRIWRHLTGNQGCAEPRVTIANHLRHLNPNAKIIIMIREPVDRIFSTYTLAAASTERLKDPSTQKLHEFIIRAVPAYKECFKNFPVRACIYNRTLADMYPVGTLADMYPIDLSGGAYAVFVEDWLRVFPPDQVYVIRFENYVNEISRSLKEVFNFLGLSAMSDAEFEAVSSMSKPSPNVYYKIGPMQNRTVKLLHDFYLPFTNRLSKLLKDDRNLKKGKSPTAKGTPS